MSRVHLMAAALVGIAALSISGLVTRAQSSPEASTARPLSTAFFDPGGSSEPSARRARAAGATFVRLVLWWSTVAPSGVTAPAGFRGSNPTDPRYQWGAFDTAVRAVVAAGLTPIVDVHDAPGWARAKTCQGQSATKCYPRSSALADFATAAARRYRGGFRGLPRVRYWQVWNEPNLSIELMPQARDGRPVSADAYRAMVNAFSRSVHAVHADNAVIAGALAPFGGNTNDPSGGQVEGQERIHPMEFMRRLLCMSAGTRPTSTCRQTVAFDVWAHHPYTYGGPTHKAFHPDDVSLGDLGKMRSLLRAAERAGHIRTRGDVGFWVTEFSYDSQPADPKGLPPALHARWVSEALYRMWSHGVSLVTWFLVSDQPFPQGMFQSGLYTEDNRAKPARQAFRFPFVAFSRPADKALVWGRTPSSKLKSVIVEQQVGDTWREVARVKSDRNGIFSGLVPSAERSGFLRARVAGGEASVPFSLTVTPDFRFCPWGSYC